MILASNILQQCTTPSLWLPSLFFSPFFLSQPFYICYLISNNNNRKWSRILHTSSPSIGENLSLSKISVFFLTERPFFGHYIIGWSKTDTSIVLTKLIWCEVLRCLKNMLLRIPSRFLPLIPLSSDKFRIMNLVGLHYAWNSNSWNQQYHQIQRSLWWHLHATDSF